MTGVILKLSSDIIGTDKTKFPEAFAKSSSRDIKSSKTQLSKITQSDEFLGRLL